jgi:hypothetical protein
MMARGMESLFAMQELSVMGIVEILKQYPRLKRRLNETADYIIAQNPDVLITIDAPEFSCAWQKSSMPNRIFPRYIMWHPPFGHGAPNARIRWLSSLIMFWHSFRLSRP